MSVSLAGSRRPSAVGAVRLPPLLVASAADPHEPTQPNTGRGDGAQTPPPLVGSTAGASAGNGMDIEERRRTLTPVAGTKTWYKLKFKNKGRLGRR